MSEKLKPCPFCGRKATLWPMRDYESVFCENCGATFEENVTGRDTDAQIKAWNTRTPPLKTHKED